MLLQALHKYATDNKLLDRLPFQTRTVHWLLPLTRHGKPRGQGFVPLTKTVTKGKNLKEEPGRELLMPGFPGENNGGRANYLAESFYCILGVRKDADESLPLTVADKKDRNPVLAHQHFWERISEGIRRTDDPRLKALLSFRTEYLSEDGECVAKFDWLNWRPNEGSRDKKPEWHGRTSIGDWKPMGKMTIIGFEVEGFPLAVPEIGWNTDPLWNDWASTYRQEAFANEEDDEGQSDDSRESSEQTVCLLTGLVGQPVARSHNPKVKGVGPKRASGRLVSFAKQWPAFSSYGFVMGDNAPVSDEAATGYVLGLNDLLSGDDTHFTVGNVTFCYWAEQSQQPVRAIGRMLNAAKPAVVTDFMGSPFAGIERSIVRKDAFLSVALESVNKARIAVREWLRVPLDEAIENVRRWFTDLEIVSLGDGKDEAETGSCSLFRLAAATVRVSKELDRMSDAVSSLYRAAWQGVAPPLRLLEPVLAEFRSALVTDSKDDPKYPFSQSRFALLKLILTRNAPEGGFMPAPHLCETDDAAYNLGRLLCILAALQDAAHDYKLEGPGIVERYYGSASAAPANVFGVLWKLHVHHLRKLEQGDGGGAAFRIRNQIADVVSGFPPAGPKQPPRFPQTLTLEEQGRFALGFYQQMAADRQSMRDAIAKKAETSSTTTK